MKILTRDISITLILKLLLLFALWFMFFKPSHKITLNKHDWFFGSTTQQIKEGGL